MAKRLPEGISLRHARSCPSRSGGRCRCAPTYQAQAWSPRDHKRLTRTFPTLAAARSWRYDARAATLPSNLRGSGLRSDSTPRHPDSRARPTVRYRSNRVARGALWRGPESNVDERAHVGERSPG
jgi:hypothetical protein